MPQGEFQYCKHYGECDEVTVKVFQLREELKVKSEELSHADLTNLTKHALLPLACAIRMVARAKRLAFCVILCFLCENIIHRML